MLIKGLRRPGSRPFPWMTGLSANKEIFEQAHFRHLLVVEEEKLVGVISTGICCAHQIPYLDTDAEMNRDTETLNRRAHQISEP